MKKLFFGLVVAMGVSQGAFADDSLKYSCHVTRWDSSKETQRNCGDVMLSLEEATPTTLKDCNVTVFGGSAAAAKGRVMTIIFGTHAQKYSEGDPLIDMTSLAIYPDSAPKEFQLSLFPGSRTHSKYSIDMECSLSR